MILEKLEIGSFGKLDNMTLNLSEGVNIVRGGNESGKTTICNFIKFIFYGLPSKVEEKLKFISWNTSVCRGAITAKNDDGKRYRIEREVVCASGAEGKPTFRERVAVFDADSGEVAFRSRQPGEAFFGVPENVFDSTVYIRQLYGTKTGDKSLCEAAENILFSGDESVNTQKALSRLDEARVYLWHKNRRGGKIYDLTEKSEVLAASLYSAQRAGGEIIYLEGTARQLSQKRDAAQKQADALSEELNTYEAYTIKRAYLKFNEEKRAKKEIEKQIDDLRFAEKFGNAPVYSDEYILRLEKMRSSLQVAEARLDEARKRYDAAKKRVYDMSEKIDVFERFGNDGYERDRIVDQAQFLNAEILKYGKIRKILFALAAIIAVFAVMALVVSLTGLAKIIPVVIALAVLAVGGGIEGMVLNSKISGPENELDEICKTFGCSTYNEFEELVRVASNDAKVISFITDERDAADGAFRAASDDLDDVNREIVTELGSANFPIETNTSASLDAAIAVCREQKAELERLQMKRSDTEDRMTEIENSIQSRDEEFVKAACTAEYDDEAMEAYDYYARRREYDFLTASIRSQTEKIHNIERDLAALQATNPRPADVAAEKEGVDGEIAKLEDEYDAVALALEAMTDASGKLREGLAPKIAKGASVIMKELSGGKYQSLGVNADLNMTFTENTASHSVEYLSAGTSDIAYISMRVALIDVLYKKSIPPFIFDESFMRMDNDRMKNSLKLLCELGEAGTQSMLFTCHGREEKLMKTIGEYTYYTI